MNKYEKEIEKVLLDNEKEILKKIKKSYAEALEKVNQRLKDLMSNELTQSKRYQLEYQKRLKKEIEAIINLLANDNINNIDKYLSKVYEDSFIGTQYVLQSAGVPFLFKINQEEVVKSISKKIEDYKLAERIYKNLNKIKSIVQNEITRGIIQGYTYSKISRQLKMNIENDLKKAYRIARTEAGRVTMEAKYSCMKRTRKNGVDIVKMWDSTIDNRTRNSHVQLDGQIKELDEPFEINGHKAMYPHNFGIAKEDINCRCGMLSRVRKGLEYDREHGFTKMVDGERKEFKNIEDYNDFKRKYFDFYKKNSSKLNDNKNIINDTLLNKEIGKSKYLNEYSNKLCNDVYNKFKENGYENIGVINVINNNVLGDIHTDKKIDSVNFSIKQINLLELQNNRSVLLVHNHPKNDTFSKNDIYKLIVNRKICGIIAVGKDYNYFLEINQQDIIKIKEFNEIWKEIELEIVNYAQKSKKITSETLHDIYIKVFEKRGWNYGRRRR